MANEIVCSRCKCRKPIPEGWQYRECVSCHFRTTQRFAKPKSFLEDFTEKANPQFPSYDRAKREKLLGNLFAEPEARPEDKPKPIDQAEEQQKQSYIKQRLEREQQQPEPDQTSTT